MKGTIMMKDNGVKYVTNKTMQLETVNTLLSLLEANVDQFIGADRVNLEKFIYTVKNNIINVISEGTKTGVYLGFWLRTHQNGMAQVLYEIPEVQSCAWDSPRLREMKQPLIEALAILLNCEQVVD